MRKHWTTVLTLLGLISSVYCDRTKDRTSDHRMQSRNSTTDHQSTSRTSDAKLTGHGNWYVGNATVTFAINVSDSPLPSIALAVFTFGVTTCCGADKYVDPANELCE